MLFLGGCSAYINRPVHTLGALAPFSKMEEHRGVAVTAEKRLVMEKNESGKDFIICAEPSPDVAQSILSIFKTTADWGKPKGLNSTELASLFSAIPFPLVVRSQGLQFYRDSVFALCQMGMNGWIGNSAQKEGNGSQKDVLFSEYKNAVKTYYEGLAAYNNNITEYNKCIVKNGGGECDELLAKSKMPEEVQEPVISEFRFALKDIRADAQKIIMEEISKGSLHYSLQIEQYREEIKAQYKLLNKLINKNEAEQSSTTVENFSSQESFDEANPQTDNTTNSTDASAQ